MLEGQKAYFIDLHLYCGGYAYFTIYTAWSDSKNKAVEGRVPSTVSLQSMQRHLDNLERSALIVLNDDDCMHWLRRRGWAFVDQAFAEKRLKSWLEPKDCLTGPQETFTDMSICSDYARNREVNPWIRDDVIRRDGNRCLSCGTVGSSEKPLTMHHVRAYSRGGETTSLNLVALCGECNRKIGPGLIPTFYELACIPHGHDLAMLGGRITSDAIISMLTLCGNMMHTRAVIL